MAKVDDLLQAGPKQIILTIVAGLAHGSPPTANLAVKGITNRQNTELKTQENRYPTPAFLQIPILAQLKLQRSINCFRILHGRLGAANISNGGGTLHPQVRCQPIPKRSGIGGPPQSAFQYDQVHRGLGHFGAPMNHT
jgi:hypothetical protein